MKVWQHFVSLSKIPFGVRGDLSMTQCGICSHLWSSLHIKSQTFIICRAKMLSNFVHPFTKNGQTSSLKTVILKIGYKRNQIPHCAKDKAFSIAYLHSCRNKQGSDHDSSSSHEVREGIYEGSHAKSPQNEVVKEAITRFVQGGSHSTAGK